MEQHEIKINLPGLLRLLGNNLYAEPDMAVRELIQNAHDTCIIRQSGDRNYRPRIDISFDKHARTLTFADNGMGMTEDELHTYLSTIGEGFTKMQKEQLRGAGAQEALLLIGQFGIGMLSAFSVAGKVDVFTRSCRPNSRGFRWECAGDIHYSVEPTTLEDAGTQVVLHLADSSLVLLDETRLQQAIKKYADFLSVPIYLKGAQANSCNPPWTKDSSLGDYADYIKARYDLDSITILPFQISKPLPLDGLLFVPMIPFELTRDFGEVDVYVSRMFIKANDKAILPGWARFFKGVINSPSLMPTVSRDELVRDANYAAICGMLGEVILEYLALLQAKAPETLAAVVQAYNNTIKASSVSDEAFFDRICDLVQVSTSDGSLSVKEYLTRSKGVIYYFSEHGSATQHNLLFAHMGVPVIDASWGVEKEFLEKYADRKHVKIERLEASSDLIFKPPESIDEKWHALEHQFHQQLGKEARAVAFEPNTIPAVLVARPVERDDKEMQDSDFSASQIRQMFQKKGNEKEKRAAGDDILLHLNTTNPLMQQLRDMNRNETFRLALTAIYHNALLFAQQYVSPANAEIIFTTNNDAISSMIGNAHALDELQSANARMEMELSELKRKTPPVKLAEQRCCFFAFDYNVPENYALMKQLQEYFAKRNLGIQVIAPVKEMHDLNILKSMYDQLQSVHFGLAEITSNNLNVIYEAGFLKGAGKPVILLKQKGTEAKVPFDFFSDYRIEYELSKWGDQVRFVWLEEELDKMMKAVFKMSPELERAAKWNG